MEIIKQTLTINYEYNVFFTEALFALENTLFSDFLKQGHHPEIAQKILFIIDEEVVRFHPQLTEQIDAYFKAYDDVQLVPRKIVIPGGEIAKNDEAYFQQLVKAV